jgi:hypothetical protein
VRVGETIQLGRDEVTITETYVFSKVPSPLGTMTLSRSHTLFVVVGVDAGAFSSSSFLLRASVCACLFAMGQEPLWRIPSQDTVHRIGKCGS